MLAEILVTLFISGYVLLAVIGHVAVLHALLLQGAPTQPEPPRLSARLHSAECESPIRIEASGTNAKRALLCIVVACALAHERPAAAETYPNRSVRIIVPFAAGGGTDAAARVIAERLSRAFGHQVFIDNRSGAGGMIGTEAVVRSAADGYTILVTSDFLTSAPHVLKMTIDPLKDLVPVIQLARQPIVLAVHPSLGVSSVAELIALAKKRPGMNYASSGTASPMTWAPQWFGQIAGIKLELVPYRGGGPAINDLIAGHVKIASLGATPVIPHYKAGTIRLLAQAGVARSPILPDVPTYQEAGIDGLVLDQWIGVFVPAGTAPAIVGRLNEAIGKALADPAVRENLLRSAQETVGGSAEQFARLVRNDTAKYGRLVRELKIKAD